MFKPPALQVVFEFPLHIARQYPAFLGQLALYFLITALSYNVFALMRQLLLGELAQHRAITIRWRLYAIAAKVVKTGRQLFVKFKEKHRRLLEQVLLALKEFESPPI